VTFCFSSYCYGVAISPSLSLASLSVISSQKEFHVILYKNSRGKLEKLANQKDNSLKVEFLLNRDWYPEDAGNGCNLCHAKPWEFPSLQHPLFSSTRPVSTLARSVHVFEDKGTYGQGSVQVSSWGHQGSGFLGPGASSGINRVCYLMTISYPQCLSALPG